jgi:glycosyltransferase involved in cell wall biosynthesis
MIEGRISILIPARNEQYLSKTVEDIYAKATGDIEVIAILDGYWPTDTLGVDIHPTLSVIHHDRSIGMRPSINEAVPYATGEFILKCDAHCMFAPGFDEVLKADCEEDWLVVPRRYGLDPVYWKRDDEARDAHYLSYPYHSNIHRPALRGQTWRTRAIEREDILIDDEMTSQGSCWLMRKAYFERFGGLDDLHYGPFVHEFQEIGNRTWLSGGRVVINKKTWYAHWYKREGQGYILSPRQSHAGIDYTVDFWMNNRWADRKYDFEWLIDKFWPVPGWPKDWKEKQCQKLA